MTPEQITTAEYVGTAVLVVLGGPAAVKAGLKWWAGYIERRAKARDANAKRDDERQADVGVWMRGKIDELGRRIEQIEDDCERRALEREEQHRQQRAQDKQDCKEEIKREVRDAIRVSRVDETQRTRAVVVDEMSKRESPLPPRGDET